ncbi:MAG: nicotinate-nucleotide adenylyltransferase [Halomonas sp.]|uniref:Probable nicotinate-nucleotide adenylyltransferase n=1 Tax=Halomonas sulfidivorans TaxID=2733488 RepID=A0ABX7WPE2_9GAMM|nr:nicotinate-nucleotide adenylyltransferase [Halomonas sulfidivorans]MDX5378780.1 nicotinate-nucleotide adenylyltransferase [Halomonas sp.]QTP61272.1 nicotinate-nucleotide adenylyltransferase [Halomonas sulfidivorans]
MEPPRVAMLGGTFDPVHLGHLRSAVELLEALRLDRVHMVPAKVPPLRGTPQVTPEERLALLRLGIGDTPGLVADPRELERDGPSYSADTLASLREEYGRQARLVMALGHDAFLRLADWHSPQRLFQLAHLVVIDRPGSDAPLPSALAKLVEGREVAGPEALMRYPAGGLLRLALPTRIAVSATEVRRRLASDRSVRYLLPEAVEARIHANLLYRCR